MNKGLLEKIVDGSEKAIIAKKVIMLKYRSSSNQVTERKFEIHDIDISPKSSDGEIDFSISGYCFLRNANRTFKLSKIEQIVDIATGEVFDDAKSFVDDLDALKFEESQIKYIDADSLYNFYFDEKDEKIYSVYSEAIIKKLNSLFSKLKYHLVMMSENTPVIIEYTPEFEDKKISKVSIQQISKISNTTFQLVCMNLETEQKEWISLEDISLVSDKKDMRIDAGKYFIDMIEQSKYYITQSIIAPLFSEIEILVYFYRTKGRMTKKDRSMINTYLFNINPRIDMDIIDEEIKSRKVSNAAYKRSIKELSEQPDILKRILIFIDENFSEEENVLSGIIEAKTILKSEL